LEHLRAAVLLELGRSREAYAFNRVLERASESR